MLADLHILLVEDSPADVLMIRRALSEAGFPHRLTTLSDGSIALAHIDHLADPSCPAELVPDLVLLDLNLPGPDGSQLLDRLKGDPLLCTIPVVILTTSSREEDIWRSYLAGANSYVQKPADYDRYRDLAVALGRYWDRTATRPPRRPPSG